MEQEPGTWNLGSCMVLRSQDRLSAVYFLNSWFPCPLLFSDCCLLCSKLEPGCKHMEGILWCSTVQHGRGRPYPELAAVTHVTSDSMWESPHSPPIQVPSTLAWRLHSLGSCQSIVGWGGRPKKRGAAWLDFPILGQGKKPLSWGWQPVGCLWWAARQRPQVYCPTNILNSKGTHHYKANQKHDDMMRKRSWKEGKMFYSLIPLTALISAFQTRRLLFSLCIGPAPAFSWIVLADSTWSQDEPSQLSPTRTADFWAKAMVATLWTHTVWGRLVVQQKITRTLSYLSSDSFPYPPPTHTHTHTVKIVLLRVFCSLLYPQLTGTGPHMTVAQ